MIPFPHYGDFTAFTPVVPELYWNVYSAEERIKALCMEWVKLTAYTDALADTVNEQYADLKADIQARYDALDAAVDNIDAVVTDMNNRFPQLVNEQVNAEIRRLIDAGEFQEILQAAVDEYWTEYGQRLTGVETGLQTLNGELTTERNARIAEDAQIREDFAADIASVNATLAADVDRLELQDEGLQDSIDKYSYPTTNPIYYGADPTGATDSSAAINACIQANENGSVIFTPGTYLVNNTISIPYDNWHISIDFNNSRIVNTVELIRLFSIGFENQQAYPPNAPQHTATPSQYSFIKNFHIESVSEWAIDVVDYFQNLHIESGSIYTTKNGLRFGTQTSISSSTWPHPSDSQINDILIANSDATQNYIGVQYLGTDNKINDCRIIGFKTCIDASIGTYIDNVHFLLANNVDGNVFDNNWCCILGNGITYVANSYCDTYPCFYKHNLGGGLHASNVNVLSYNEAILQDCIIFDFMNIINYAEQAINFSILNIDINTTKYPANTIIVRYPNPSEKTFNASDQTFVREFSSGDYNNVRFTNRAKLQANANAKFDLIWKKTNINTILEVQNRITNTSNWYYVGSIPLAKDNANVFEIEASNTDGLNATVLNSGKFNLKISGDKRTVQAINKISSTNLECGCDYDQTYAHIYVKTSNPCIAPFTMKATQPIADLVSNTVINSAAALNDRFPNFKVKTSVMVSTES